MSQHIYWKKSTYTWTHAVQTCVLFKGQLYLETSQEPKEVDESPIKSNKNEAKRSKIMYQSHRAERGQGFQARLLGSTHRAAGAGPRLRHCRYQMTTGSVTARSPGAKLHTNLLPVGRLKARTLLPNISCVQQTNTESTPPCLHCQHQ